jgi:hypothetical protein
MQQDQDMNYGEGMTDPYDQQVGGYPGSAVGSVGFQDPDCSIQFEEMTPSEVGMYPASMGGASSYQATSRNEHML